MFNSVRVRLTLWYTAVLTCVLVVLAIATYFVLRQNFTHRTDASLVELAESFLATVNAEVRDELEPNGFSEGISAAISEHKFRDIVFVVVDQQGGIIASSDPSFERNKPDQERPENLRDLMVHMLQVAQPFQTMHIGERGYRSYVRRFPIAKTNYALIVLQSMHHQEELLESVTASFGIAIPLAVLLASAGGYFLARRSLSPVVAMSGQAGRIGAENLHQRLEVRNARDELGHLAQSFNSLLDRLDQSFERQRRFMADASHELRTPVAILCGEADVTLSQSNRSTAEYKASLCILGAEAKRLKHIVEDLFTLARADAGQHPLMLEYFYLDELAAECARNVRTLASPKQITLRCEAPKEMLICADEALLRRMLMNLLDNAIKYTPEGGTVSITSEEQSGFYVVSIRDTGQGIPSELQPRIFERFFRADKVRSRSEDKGGGAGLGLSISLWIAEAHGGRLELTHSGQDGSTFKVFLPVKAAPR
jgi:heavy metal sensor kinase